MSVLSKAFWYDPRRPQQPGLLHLITETLWVHLMLGPLLKSSCLKQHWESNQQWKLHIFAKAWCCFPAKNSINLHFVYTDSHTGCQQVFVWFLKAFTSSLLFTLYVSPEIISFFFCPIWTALISLLSLWVLFYVYLLKISSSDYHILSHFFT